jgi:hypothetical protein
MGKTGIADSSKQKTGFGLRFGLDCGVSFRGEKGLPQRSQRSRAEFAEKRKPELSAQAEACATEGYS